MPIIKKIYDKSTLLQKIYQRSPLTGPLHDLKRLGFYCYIKFRTLKQYLSTIPRQFGLKQKRYLPIKALKDSYSGKRCFIICTGPSLTIEDLESLSGEYTFGMNSLCFLHDKTNWHPDFFGVQDDHVYKKIFDTLISTDNGVVLAPYKRPAKLNEETKWVELPVCGAYHRYELRYRQEKMYSKFSEDCYVRIYDGYTITYTLIQMAIYMGFKEIYLLGADFSYLGNKQHFIEHGHVDPGYAKAPDKMLVSYLKAKEYAEKNGILIANATRGGMLEVFPRVTLEEVLGKKEKNKEYQ